jgi:hypothetical protein
VQDVDAFLEKGGERVDVSELGGSQHQALLVEDELPHAVCMRECKGFGNAWHQHLLLTKLLDLQGLVLQHNRLGVLGVVQMQLKRVDGIRQVGNGLKPHLGHGQMGAR